MKHLTNCELKCDTCITKHWVTDKEWNYSQITHLPITLVCHIDGEHIVRGTNACIKHQLYNQGKNNRKKQK